MTPEVAESLEYEPFVYNDGGRTAAGWLGKAPGDCVVRSIAIASGLPYRDLYDRIMALAMTERRTKRRKARSHPRTGVHTTSAPFKRFMTELGFEWVATMQIGSGCQVHLRSDELPSGRLVVALSRHWTAVINGVIHDTADPSRGGTRCVYGYWRFTRHVPIDLSPVLKVQES